MAGLISSGSALAAGLMSVPLSRLALAAGLTESAHPSGSAYAAGPTVAGLSSSRSALMAGLLSVPLSGLALAAGSTGSAHTSGSAFAAG